MFHCFLSEQITDRKFINTMHTFSKPLKAIKKIRKNNLVYSESFIAANG